MKTKPLPSGRKTQQRGADDMEYQLYVSDAQSLGWYVKTYDEWLETGDNNNPTKTGEWAWKR